MTRILLSLACGAPRLTKVTSKTALPAVQVFTVSGSFDTEGQKHVQVAVSAPGGARKLASHLPSKWVLDSGCGFDLIGLNDVSERDKSRIVDAISPIVLHTAGGEVSIDKL